MREIFRINESMTTAKIAKFHININKNRDDLLTNFGKALLKDRYLLQGEDFQDLYIDSINKTFKDTIMA